MHYLRCTISEHTNPSSQELPKWLSEKKAVVFRLLQQILWDELILMCMHYCHAKATFQEEQRVLTVKK